MTKLKLGFTRTSKTATLDVDNLTTHGMIVGMTGSGKTGLGIGLIEETLAQGVNCLVLDPKGDMGNLALVFPSLSDADFTPWTEDDPTEVATKHVEGMVNDGITLSEIKALADIDLTIYTPGSHMGQAINVIGSLDPPDLHWNTDAELMREEIHALVTSIFSLAGIKVKTDGAVENYEHILVCALIEHFWRKRREVDLSVIIKALAQPPITKLGEKQVDEALNPRKREELALKLNKLLASPRFAVWREGVPLDVEAMIGQGDRTKCAIIYLNHLDESERQSFVSFLLAKVIAWMRTKEGSKNLNTLIYLDEAFGYLPPVGNPPTKTPIMTILKQARAFGVGMVVSTQNPMDMDYKAMSNAGTWMIGRLNTANDKRRVLEALKAADGYADISRLDRDITRLDKREFLLYSISTKPRIFKTRWTISYLAGPLSRNQLIKLKNHLTPARNLVQ